MALQDELTAAQRCLDELIRTVGRLEQHVGGGLELRRVRSDTEHLRESLGLLRASAPQERPAMPGPEMVPVPDTPYDSSLWADADEEGVGSRDRRAP
ncbi:hypothetical protein [Streptomyces oceani]|uniref:Uncharacterized protein n=1 Tax=Streptomyces oceani TaxID=1075402 RepID=A0A1E7JJ62_9ACTN|nr:hypothetical protein [Streptomyces oceani]OEU87662.1 hypothetical protein AN216_26030 [Streptomyces oceani]